MFSNGDVLLIIMTLILSIFLFKPIFHKLQLYGYKLSGFFKKYKYSKNQYILHTLVSAFFIILLCVGVNLKNKPSYSFVLCFLYFILEIFLVARLYRMEYKTPFVYTKRIVRMYFMSFIIHCIVLNIGVIQINKHFDPYFNKILFFGFPVIVPLLCYLSFLILWPFEKLNNNRYVKHASDMLNNQNYLIKIGITGSFGKTTVKNILKTLLEQKYKVIATKGNFNTPLGISKTVNDFDEVYDIFIAEMGARYVNDIKTLAKMVQPKYAIITGVTTQHLETFKTLDNIYAEKFSLIESLPSDGYAVVNELGIDRKPDLKTEAIVEYVGKAGSLVYAKEIKSNSNGSDFVLVINGKEYNANTKLLGEHNIQNIVVAAALAYKLEVSPTDIIKAIKCIKPVTHRLQLIKNGKLTIIDDTYNSNPVGANQAIKVLGTFDSRKIVITPGMVELGVEEEKENRNLGKAIAKIADLVILIGKIQTEPIKLGLEEENFPLENVKIYNSLNNAERDFGKLLKNGDTVLFLNDLPDNYTE